MCGIVERPTRRKDFDPKQMSYRQLSERTVLRIAGLCEDVHIPSLAAHLVLAFADATAGKPELVMQNIPFALYQNGKRYVTEASIRSEEAVMHLAMAGSVRHFINEELLKYGMQLEMGHCCDIQLHSVVHRHEAMDLSHDGNVYRADRLRNMKVKDVVTVTTSEFVNLVEDDETKRLVVLMHDLVESDISSMHIAFE